MNNRRLALLAFLLLFPVLSFSQQQFLDAPFGGGGGFLAGWQFADVKPLNTAPFSNMPKLSESGVFTTGGGGFIYIGFIPNIRVGGMGFGGSTSKRSGVDANGFSREVEYSIGGGAFTIEYSMPFIRNIGVSAGLSIGGGSINVDYYLSRGSASWDNLWQDRVGIPGFSSDDRYVHVSRSYWIFTPTLTVDIPVTRFVAFRVGGGYQLTAGGTWRYNNDIEISNAPSGFNGNSFFIQAGLIAGFFSF